MQEDGEVLRQALYQSVAEKECMKMHENCQVVTEKIGVKKVWHRVPGLGEESPQVDEEQNCSLALG